MTCLFCNLNDEQKVFENELAQAIFDQFPVAQGHMLIIPKRHVSRFFDLTKAEHEAVQELLEKSQSYLAEKYQPDAYNIGVNVGEAAGQTIFHCHVHLIPRYTGDVENPTGGVRAVIPEKQNYRK